MSMPGANKRKSVNRNEIVDSSEGVTCTSAGESTTRVLCPTQFYKKAASKSSNSQDEIRNTLVPAKSVPSIAQPLDSIQPKISSVNCDKAIASVSKSGVNKRKSVRGYVVLNNPTIVESTSASEVPRKVSRRSKSHKAGINAGSTCQGRVHHLSVSRKLSTISQLPDEILLEIFKMLDVAAIFQVINRVCRRWNLLSKDKYLWREIYLGFVGLESKSVMPIVKQYCSEVTELLTLRAKSERYGDDCSWDEYTAPQCLTRSVITNIKKKSPNLQSFEISYEQITSALSPKGKSFFSCLPDTLTHLSLENCKLEPTVLTGLFAKNFPLRCLESLDLSSIVVLGCADLRNSQLQLPRTLTNLSVQDIDPSVSLFDLIPIIAKHTNLYSLDISFNHIDMRDLNCLATRFNKLEEFYMSGCLLADYEASAYYHDDYNTVTKEEWYDVFRNGFPSLTTLNINDVVQNTGHCMYSINCLSLDIPNVIDTDGTSWGEWSDYKLSGNYNKYDFFERYKEDWKEDPKNWSYGERDSNLYGSDYDSDEDIPVPYSLPRLMD